MKKNKNFYYFLLILSVLVYAIYSTLWEDVNMVRPDLPAYLSAAQDISDGQIDNLNIRVPGFPILLLITGSKIQPTVILFYTQLLLYVLAVMALSWMLYKLHVHKLHVLLFSIIAFLPYNIVITTLAMSETLTAFLLVYGFFFLFYWLLKEKYLFLILSALFFGYVAITRPTYQIIGVLFVFIFICSLPILKVYKKKMLYSILAIGMISSIFVGSIIYNNYQKFNFVGVTPLFGFNLSTKTTFVIDRLPEKYAEVKDILIYYRNKDFLETSDHNARMYIWDAIPDLEKATGLDLSELSNYMKELNLDLIKRAPQPYMREVGASIASYWLPYVQVESFFGMKILQFIYVLIHFIVFGGFFLLLVFMMGLIFVSIFFKNQFQFFEKIDELYIIVLLIPIAIIFYTMLISTLFEVGNPRYRASTDLLILFSVFAMFNFIKNKIPKKIS